jgi:hypothetical protein
MQKTFMRFQLIPLIRQIALDIADPSQTSILSAHLGVLLGQSLGRQDFFQLNLTRHCNRARPLSPTEMLRKFYSMKMSLVQKCIQR